ncbi:MAG: ATP-binding protein [Clostridia bacterium]|nr:ATP-binding protein [Clostridia bacterium]
MEEFSLYVLDITMNSVRAGADKIGITLEESDGILTFTVTDNGCGMNEETVRRITDPFFTTRKTRGVGLGVPFLKMLSEQTGGSLSIESKCRDEYPEDHGTKLRATFGLDHIDFIPLGDMTGTVVALIQGNPEIDFTYDHITPRGTVHLSCAELKAVLGEEISLASFEVLEWIRGYLEERYNEIDK